MKLKILSLLIVFSCSSCFVTTKKLAEVEADYQDKLAMSNEKLGTAEARIKDFKVQLDNSAKEKSRIEADYKTAQSTLKVRDDQIKDLKSQIADVKTQRDKQMSQVGDLTVLSQTANSNIKETLTQLERKDAYIKLLQAAKTTADSINLTLAINLQNALKDELTSGNVEIKVDKTVVAINLSDKLFFQPSSTDLTPKALEVLGKIATTLKAQPTTKIMVEGHTDNLPSKNECMEDNWDLSVKRATSVVRVLQKDHGFVPQNLTASGKSQFSAITTNDTFDNRALNRRTSILVLPDAHQFYDLLNPANIPE